MAIAGSGNFGEKFSSSLPQIGVALSES